MSSDAASQSISHPISDFESISSESSFDMSSLASEPISRAEVTTELSEADSKTIIKSSKFYFDEGMVVIRVRFASNLV